MLVKFRFKLQAIAERNAKNLRGHFLPHPACNTLESNTIWETDGRPDKETCLFVRPSVRLLDGIWHLVGLLVRSSRQLKSLGQSLT